MTSKKIKANDIINLHSKEFSYKKIIITTPNKQEFEVLVQEKLNDTTIMNLVSDLIERSNYCKKNNIEFNEILNTYFLLIKYFTDIQFGNYKSIKKQYSHELQVVNCLIDLEIFTQIISNFDKETMDKISKVMNQYAKQMDVITNNKIAEMLEKEFQTKVEIKNEEEL